jgi:hypothetical protein
MQGKIGSKETTAIQRKAHEVLSEAFGDMVVEVGKASYYHEGHQVDLKFSIGYKDALDDVKNQALELYGLEGWKVGDIFELYGEKYRLEGYNPKARKFPILMTRLSDNSKRKAQESYLKAGKKIEA